MDLLWQFEIQINIFLQGLGDWLVSFMKFFSFLGTENFYFIVLPFIFWSVDSAFGARVGAMLMFNHWINGLFKMMLHTPRPFWYNTEVRALSAETSFGMPSGHAMSAASLLGLLAHYFKKRWFTIVCILVIFMIGISRLYLGMHFSSDVLVGWALGAALLLIFVRVEGRVVEWIKAKSLEQQLSIILISSLFILLLTSLIIFFSRNWQMPDAWFNNATRALPDSPPDPFNLDGIITISGLWLGMFGGLAWFYKRYGMFNASGALWKRLVRYVVGLAGLMVFWYGLGQIFPRNADLLSFVLRYVRYALVGVWLSALAPWLFIRLRLASKYEK